MKTIESMLAEHPFFQGLNQRSLHIAAHGAVEDKFGSHAYIFNEGEKAGKFYALRKGKVALEGVSPLDELVTIDTLEAGDIYLGRGSCLHIVGNIAPGLLNQCR